MTIRRLGLSKSGPVPNALPFDDLPRLAKAPTREPWVTVHSH